MQPITPTAAAATSDRNHDRPFAESGTDSQQENRPCSCAVAAHLPRVLAVWQARQPGPSSGQFYRARV